MISIIIPNYNHSKYLRKRIESILSQTYTDYECILLDDASSDNSIEILNEYVKLDSRLKLFINRCNSGSTFAQWNYGISKARGKYIWIAESDDIASPYFLKTMVEVLDQNPKISVTFCQSTLIDCNGLSSSLWPYDDVLFHNNFIFNGIDFINKYLIKFNFIPNASAVLFRKSDYNAVGKSVEWLNNNGDWNLWLKLLTLGDLFYLSSPLNYFRKHEQSVTAKASLLNIDQNRIDCNLAKLRSEYNAFLLTLNEKKVFKIIIQNRLLLSYEWGNFGLYLHKQKKYLSSLYFILKASFYPNFKTYYLKRLVFGNFYHRLFEK